VQETQKIQSPLLSSQKTSRKPSTDKDKDSLVQDDGTDPILESSFDISEKIADISAEFPSSPTTLVKNSTVE